MYANDNKDQENGNRASQTKGELNCLTCDSASGARTHDSESPTY